jgi:hypothetical protein
MSTYKEPFNEHPQNFNVWEKVLHPNRVLPQMASDTIQPRFFFGGSQVPTALNGHIGGEGLKSHKFTSNYENSICKAKGLKETVDQQGRHKFTSVNKNHNILLPKNLLR